MPDPVGLSALFPTIPIMSAISTTLMLMLLPGFWKTRVICLLAAVGWLIIGNLLLTIGWVGWRGNVKDAPIYADIIGALRYIQPTGSMVAMACFSNFVYQRLRPLSARQFYDSRRKQNRLDFFLTFVLPLLWLPTRLLVSPSRYVITEDYGPLYWMNIDVLGFIIQILPVSLGATVVAVFNLIVLAVITFWRAGQDITVSAMGTRNAAVRTRKLVLFSFTNLFLAMFAMYNTTGSFLQKNPTFTWTSPRLAQNLQGLRIVIFVSRADLDATPYEIRVLKCQTISKICLGFYMFAWFGFGEEARRPYREALARILRLLGFRSRLNNSTVAKRPSSYWANGFRKLESRLHLNTALPRTDAMGSTGSAISDDFQPSFPLETPGAYIFGSSDTADDLEGGRTRIYAEERRPSQHKSLLPISLADVQTLARAWRNTGPRRVSHHKSILTAASPSVPISSGVPPQRPAPCRSSYRKLSPSSEDARAFDGRSISGPPNRRQSLKADFVTSTLSGTDEWGDEESPHTALHPRLQSSTSPMDFTAPETPFDLLPIQLFLPPVLHARKTEFRMASLAPAHN